MIKNEEEYYEYKEKLRKEAFTKELDRIKVRSSKLRNIIRAISVASAIFVILFGLEFYFNLKNLDIVGRKKAHSELYQADTTPIKPIVQIDTVYIQKTNPFALASFYTVQVGAFKSELVPELKDLDDFPMIKYTYDENQCVAFGKFETIEFAEKGLMFLRKLGFTNTMIVKVENGERVKVVM